MQLTARNATLDDLASMLKTQHLRKLDVVAPAASIRSEGGVLRIAGTDADLSDLGPVPTEGLFVPTTIADEGLAEKLGIPIAYLKRLRADRPDLFDANVNGWLHGTPTEAPPTPEWENSRYAEADPRKFLVRCFRGDPGEPGVARAVLSDGFKIIDNLDVLTAALEGVREAGVNVEIDGCDLTERKMYVRVVAPEVTALAPVLMRAYRDPFGDGGATRAGWTPEAEARWRDHSGYGRGEEPIVFAGFVISNSEVGGGACQIVPRMIVQICRNGLTITRDALRSVHLGSKLDEGVIRWSTETMKKSLDLVTSQARDAVATFLDVDYMTMVIARMEEQAEHRLSNPAEAVKIVGQRLKFSEARTNSVLDFFVRGGQTTAGGVLNAITAYAQTVTDADEAFEIEALAPRALDVAATL